MNCPKGFYAEKLTNTCNKCDISCTSCIGKESTDCNSCATGKFYNELTKKCVDNCPIGYYNDQNN
jgi:proprotein convertase subtilisin/kexin type 5